MSFFSKSCVFAALSVPAIAAIGQPGIAPVGNLFASIPNGLASAKELDPSASPATSSGNPALAAGNPALASGNPALASGNPALASGNPALASSGTPAMGGAPSAGMGLNGVKTTTVENPDGSRTQTIIFPAGTFTSDAGGGSGQPGLEGNGPMAVASNVPPSPAMIAATPSESASVAPLSAEANEESPKAVAIESQCDQVVYCFEPTFYPVTRVYRTAPVRVVYGYPSVQCVVGQ
jgi:hypothetical protein